MTKVFVGTTLGLLYKLENDNCHFHDKIRFAKELFNLLASTEQFALETCFLSSIGIVKRKQWATFLLCRFGKHFCASRWIYLSNCRSHIRLDRILKDTKHLFGGHITSRICDVQNNVSLNGFGTSRSKQQFLKGVFLLVFSSFR